jgi:NitT/TauT family transport system substrate-binding protein
MIAGTFFCLLFWCGSGKAADSPKKLRLAYAEWGIGSAVAYVGIDGGIFKKFKIDVEEMLFKDALAGGVNSLVGADILLGFGNPLIIMQPILGGADLVFLGSHVSTEKFGMCVTANISSLKDLKGKKIGVSSLGEKSDLAARIILRRAGLNPGKDLKFVVAGFSADRALAIVNNEIQATPLNIDRSAQARQLGLKVLEVKEVPIVDSLLITTKSFVKRDEELARRFVKAYVTAIHFYLTHRNESLSIIKKYFSRTDPKALELMYETYASQLEKLPLFNRESLEAMIDAAGVVDSRASSLKVSDIIDSHFLEELKSGGYINQLYREKVEL